MATQNRRERQISVVIYPGLTTLELIGTVSVLDGLGLETGLQPITVGENREPVSPNTPLELVPQATFEDVSRPFGLLVPGGGPNAIAAMGDERLLDYVRSAAEEAELVASVGTGSLILAAAGLLDGRRATAPPAYRGILANLGAEYADDRWVEDGEFTTAGGTSGGIDMGLHLVAKHRDKRSARQVQLWVEYDPQPPFGPMDHDATGEELAQLLARHRVDPEQSLAHRSDLLEAVRGALRPAARAKTGR